MTTSLNLDEVAGLMRQAGVKEEEIEKLLSERRAQAEQRPLETVSNLILKVFFLQYVEMAECRYWLTMITFKKLHIIG